MPIVSALGAMSSRGFGEFAQSSASGKYIEDYFSTYLYNGSSATKIITNNVPLENTAAWSTIQFSKNLTANTVIYDVTTDSSNNVYVAGTYADSGPSQNFMYLAKYDSTNTLLWQRKFSAASQANATYAFRGVAVASSGNVYVVGMCQSTDRIYTLKYNSSGVLQWQRMLYQTGYVDTGDIGIDSSENVYITGSFNDGTRRVCAIAKYNTSGAIQWQRKYYQNNSSGIGLRVDSSGNVYVCGSANDGSYTYGFLVKYNTSGSLQFQKKLSWTGSTIIYRAVDIDSSGNIYTVGIANNSSIFVKYNSSGTLQFQKRVTGCSTNDINNIYIDSSNNIYLAVISQPNNNYAWGIVKYNTSGTYQSSRVLQSQNSVPWSVTSDSAGNLICAGRINDSTNNYALGAVCKLKTDGSTTSGTAILSLYSNLVNVDDTTTWTDATGTGTDAAGTGTDAAGVGTDAAADPTETKATQLAVTGNAGLVWIKDRLSAVKHALFDTVNGPQKYLSSNATTGQQTDTISLTSFTTSGFTLGSDTNSYFVNVSGDIFTSWTFRESAKFFDIVTYTGDGVAGRTVSHNLGSVPGMIIVKAVNGNSSWQVYHRSLGGTKYLQLDLTNAEATSNTRWNNTDPTSTIFTLGSSSTVNGNGVNYVAYIFAHDAGGFGLDGSQNVISCGSYTGTGAEPINVTVGFEPQWLLVKRATGGTGDWYLLDNMRGMTAYQQAGDSELYPNTSTAEQTGQISFGPTATGFVVKNVGAINVSGSTYIYMAIRRGPMKVPTDATTVFSPVLYTGNGVAKSITTGFPVDTEVVMARSTFGSWQPGWLSRLTGNGFYLQSSSTAAEVDWSGNLTNEFQSNTSVNRSSAYLNNNGSMITQSFRRAPSFMDVVCYTGNGGTSQNVSHNLNAVPELMIFKQRSVTGYWRVWASSMAVNYAAYLNTTDAIANQGTGFMYDTLPTKNVFTVGYSAEVNNSGRTYVAYLFATCPGVSKVGSYTGTGATQTISCGFTGGARYVLIKRTDSTGNWWVWDTARGMVAGTDPRIPYNTAANETNADWVYTTTGGFQIVTSDATVNANGASYIFLAIS